MVMHCVPKRLDPRIVLLLEVKKKEARSSVEEHYLDVVGVSGSKPLVPTGADSRHWLFGGERCVL